MAHRHAPFTESDEDLRTQNARDFLSEIVELGKTRGLSLSHEDAHGGFIVEDFDPQLADWLLDAADDTSESEGETS